MIKYYDSIDDNVVRRLARRITVCTSGQTRYPYRAVYEIAVPRSIAEGQPRQLSATGATAQEVVGGLVGMLVTWYEDPTSPTLEASEDDSRGERRAPGLTLARPIPATSPAAPARKVA